ncbi:MAG: PepSY domain-containing protein [Gammaproteobacteria bacterium]|nr:PepSY domain-containing protein [Gammaproteobacteria bacterium]
MNIIRALVLVGIAALSTTVSAVNAKANPPAKLSIKQAQSIALDIAPGVVVDAEYEQESGAWRYSFDIRQGQRIHEIGVDANSGKIVEDSYEALDAKD